MPYPKAAVVADLRRRGSADLLQLYDCPDGTLRAWYGKGDGTFRPGPVVAAVSDHVYTPSMIVADFNGDGRPDVAEVAPGSPYGVSGNRAYSMVAGRFGGHGELGLAVLTDAGVAVLLPRPAQPAPHAATPTSADRGAGG